MKIFLGLLVTLFVAALGLAIFLGVYGGKDTVTYEEEVALVLGSSIFCSHDDEAYPSVVLKNRLDTAIEYHKKNPTAKIIVTGGNEKDLCESEAEVMKLYLTERDVPADLILIEDKSTSTTENFKFSREIMQQHNLNYAVIITSRSHMFRAERTAQRMGVTAKKLSAPEPWYMWPLVYGYETPRTMLFMVHPPEAVRVE